MNRMVMVLLASGASLCLGWMNPTRDRVASGNRQYAEGHYEQAITTYGELLVDNPDSPLLNFNIGNAKYKAGQYAEAIASFTRVQTGDDPMWAARVAFNTGNAHYRLGAAAERTNPQEALAAYASALASYRRALGADSTDTDAKFNYEFVTHKLEALKQRLEEQAQQQDPPPDERETQSRPGEQPDEGEETPDRPEDATGKPNEQPAESARQEAADATAGATGEAADAMTPEEAAALIDTARNDELRPEEFARHVQGGALAEPVRDW